MKKWWYIRNAAGGAVRLDFTVDYVPETASCVFSSEEIADSFLQFFLNADVDSAKACSIEELSGSEMQAKLKALLTSDGVKRFWVNPTPKSNRGWETELHLTQNSDHILL
jgi:hypothetical protein